MDDLERQLEEFARAMDELQRSGSLSTASLDKLRRATDDLGEEELSTAEKFKEAGKIVSQGLVDTAVRVRESRESFESLAPAVDALEGAIGIFSESAGRIVGGLGRFALTEIQGTVDSFNTIAGVGMATGDGLTGMRESAIDAGLSLDSFANVLSNQASNLAFAFGDTVQGMQSIVAITKAAEPLQTQFLNLGVGFEEQAEMFGDYAKFQALIGRNQRRDYQALAAGTLEYTKELNELSALTGLQRDQAQEALLQQQSDARFRALTRQLEASGQDELAKDLRAMGIYLREKGGPELQQGFQDSLTNFGTEAAQNFGILVGTDIGSAVMNREMGLANVISTVQDRFTSLEGRLDLPQLLNLGVISDQLALDLMNFAGAQRLTAEEIEELRKRTEDAANTQDEETKKVRDAQIALRDLAIQVDKIVQDMIFPYAATAVQFFTETMAKGVTELNDLMGIGDTDTTNTQGPARIQYPGITILPTGTTATNVPGSAVYNPQLPGTLPSFENIYGTRANGGSITANQNYLVGERGPEILNTNTSGMVLTYEQMMSKIGVFDTLMNNIDHSGISGFNSEFASMMSSLNDMTKVMDSMSGSADYFIRSIDTGDFRTSGPAMSYNNIASASSADLQLTDKLNNLNSTNQESSASLKSQNSLLADQLTKLDALITAVNRNTDVNNQILRANTA